VCACVCQQKKRNKNEGIKDPLKKGKSAELARELARGLTPKKNVLANSLPFNQTGQYPWEGYR
jgi:hypothetical protein